MCVPAAVYAPDASHVRGDGQAAESTNRCPEQGDQHSRLISYFPSCCRSIWLRLFKRGFSSAEPSPGHGKTSPYQDSRTCGCKHRDGLSNHTVDFTGMRKTQPTPELSSSAVGRIAGTLDQTAIEPIENQLMLFGWLSSIAVVDKGYDSFCFLIRKPDGNRPPLTA